MVQVKTAISIDESLFREVSAVAIKTKIPRSRLFEEAIRKYLDKTEDETKKLLQQINSAYNDMPDVSEKRQQEHVRRHMSKLLEGEW